MNSRKINLILLLLMLSASLFAVSWVKVAHNPEEGWKLLVDGEQIPVHGVVWSFTPIGENYSYSLWDRPRDEIQRMIDTDGELLQEMGVNVVRCFSDIPPEWVTYLYQKYGIYTVINDLFGRYGMTVNGRWGGTDYSDMETRTQILKELEANVSRYKDVPGVLYYLLGNENNYGLEWESDRIENLPVGARMETRAGYLYSLFEEGIQLVKSIDPTKPVGIVNGDIQYLNIIQALVPSLDILGVNTYRGDAAYDLFYESVQESLNVPIVYTELGADAFNAVTGEEDQYNQARIIESQWEEIYLQSYNKGGYQNCLGAFVFEWIDEWWKHGMTEDLDIHDPEGSWANGAYRFDSAPGVNNMNEEWFGIAAQSTEKRDGIHVRVPRIAYYTLRDIWALDQILSTREEVEEHFAALDVVDYLVIGESAAIKAAEKEDPVISLSGSVTVMAKSGTTDFDWENNEKEGIESSLGEWAFLGVDVAPLENLEGGLTLRVQGDVPETYFENEVYSKYESETVDSSVLEGDSDSALWSEPLLEIYDAYFHYEEELFDLDGYFHNGHTDWVGEGDFFNILPECFDFTGMDIDDSRAPIGLEFTGKESLEGLKVYGGPEIFWGADPQIIAKYYRPGSTVSWSAVYDEVFSLENPEVAAGSYERRASLYGGLNLSPLFTLDGGVLHSGSEKIGELYDDVDKDGNVTDDVEIDALDTLAFRFEAKSQAFLYTTLFARYTYAGLVASSNGRMSRDGSQIVDNGSGNRSELVAGGRFTYGNLSVMPKVLYRQPLSYPLSTSDGGPRYALNDPFYVWGNRESLQAELLVSWDSAGETYFFDWDNNERENAGLAGYVSFLYSFYEGPTDAASYTNEYGNSASFTFGLPEETGLWSLVSRIVVNPLPDTKVVLTGRAGTGQSTGEDDRTVNYYGAGAAARCGNWMLDLSADVNYWGSEDWYRQFNLTFPLQWTAELAYGFDEPSFLDKDNRIGLRWRGRTYDEYSDTGESENGLYDWRSEITGYVNVAW